MPVEPGSPDCVQPLNVQSLKPPFDTRFGTTTANAFVSKSEYDGYPAQTVAVEARTNAATASFPIFILQFSIFNFQFLWFLCSSFFVLRIAHHASRDTPQFQARVAVFHPSN